ncbi:hypothetical protein LSTR_LSTR006320 [Laodelphax striatellus]|uniref:G-protein coupled receptors family 3 profile domain-containing protein n=1 Tax=Laodelphax striatellus TaxID=195883 RepID=A0A482WKE8_LAOST|nr:hypothetical protein LSTR_LSTR006320 [Laodelphax striatellus]
MYVDMANLEMLLMIILACGPMTSIGLTQQSHCLETQNKECFPDTIKSFIVITPQTITSFTNTDDHSKCHILTELRTQVEDWHCIADGRPVPCTFCLSYDFITASRRNHNNHVRDNIPLFHHHLYVITCNKWAYYFNMTIMSASIALASLVAYMSWDGRRVPPFVTTTHQTAPALILLMLSWFCCRDETGSIGIE